MNQEMMTTSAVPAAPALGLRLDGSVALVNSRDVAERFGKRHDHVLRDIDVLLANGHGLASPSQDSSPDLGDVPFQQLGGWPRESSPCSEGAP